MELIQRSADATQREEVYELLGRAGMLAPQDNLRRQHFWTGIVLYRSQQWDAALAEFRQVTEAAGSDGPSEFYIRRIEQARAGKPTLDWTTARL